jgi:hypothetical protein
MEALGREQLAFSRRQYAEMMPLARQVYGQQMDAQRQQMEQAQNYFDYQQQTFRPVEQGLVRDAERFNTEAYREQLAGQAAAAAGRAFGVQQGMGQRAMAARGVNPNSGAAMAMQAQGNLGLAAQRANAMTGARTQAEQLGFARRMDVTGLGRNLAGASTAAYGGATSAGTAGMNTAMAPGGQRMQGMQQAGQTMGNVLSSQTSAYNSAMQNQGLDVGGLLQGGAAMYTAFSDRRLKTNVRLVSTDPASGFNLYEYEYTFLPGKTFRGVMADEVELVVPEAVFTDANGFKSVNYGLIGVDMVEV